MIPDCPLCDIQLRPRLYKGRPNYWNPIQLHLGEHHRIPLDRQVAVLEAIDLAEPVAMVTV